MIGKRLFFAFAVPLLLVIFPLIIFSTKVLASYHQNLPQVQRFIDREERRDEVKERVATRSVQVRQRRAERLKIVFQRILDRYRAALNRLEKIVTKLEKRIEKLKARGVDTAGAQAKLEGCNAKKTAASAAIDDAKSKIESIDASSAIVADTVRMAVDSLHLAKRAIRDYHKCLVDVTRTLKASQRTEGTGGAE